VFFRRKHFKNYNIDPGRSFLWIGFGRIFIIYCKK
jgi:hypothetical protein